VSRRGRKHAVLTLVAIVAAAFNVRIGVSAVGPLIDQIRADTGMSATLAGALGSIPFACMGLFALVGVPLVLRLGARRLIALSLVLLVVSTVTRAVMPTAGLIVACTVPLGVAIALIGLALPGVVKRGFPDRTGAGMGAYVAALSTGAALSALTMVPLSNALGGWRGAFAVSAIPTILAIPLWLLLPASEAHADPNVAINGGEPMRERLPSLLRRPPRRAYVTAAAFGLQSMCFAAVSTWIAALYHQSGWSPGDAAFTTALISILTVPAALVIASLSDRGDRRRWVFVSAVMMTFGIFGLAFAPTAAPWLWIVPFGIGNGSLFPLTLTLPQDLADNPRERVELTAWTLAMGYAISATGPLIVGGLHDVTGGFALPMAVIGVAGALEAVIALAPSLSRTGFAASPGLRSSVVKTP
jgi:CP family cyanate transporter-like MFS transporter